jgi:phospholipid/cholesterol/gamma-HCH transport system permease protein
MRIKHPLSVFFGKLGHFAMFTGGILSGYPRKRIHSYELLMQIFFTGVLTLIIILLSGLFIGGVLALQGAYILRMFAAENELGQLVTLTTFRELGPVVTALLFTGRAGTSMASEIGVMQLTEQIDALKTMDINPKQYLLFPRFMGGIIALPLLTIIFNAFAIIGGHLVSVYWLDIDIGLFWISIKSSVLFDQDVLTGLFKSLVFAILINSIALYQGYYTIKSAEGIAQSATKTVVYSSVLILLSDLILTAGMMRIWQ